MSKIRPLIEVLRTRSDVSIVEETQVWQLLIRKGQDLIVEIAVPHEALEWHACLKREGDKRELWSDWMDYSGYDDRSKETLDAEMADDILAFVDRVSVSDLLLPLRIYEERT